MRSHLKVALANYSDFDLELKNWTFQGPYSPIVHRWDRLNAQYKETTEPESKEALGNLLEFLRPILVSSVDSLIQTKETGKVSFENLWQIFPPGELAVTSFFGIQAVSRLLRYELVQPNNQLPWWNVEYEYVDWNGQYCGYEKAKTKIRYFTGLKFVDTLGV